MLYIITMMARWSSRRKNICEKPQTTATTSVIQKFGPNESKRWFCALQTVNIHQRVTTKKIFGLSSLARFGLYLYNWCLVVPTFQLSAIHIYIYVYNIISTNPFILSRNELSWTIQVRGAGQHFLSVSIDVFRSQKWTKKMCILNSTQFWAIHI